MCASRCCLQGEVCSPALGLLDNRIVPRLRTHSRGLSHLPLWTFPFSLQRILSLLSICTHFIPSLKIKLKASHMLCKPSATELYPQPYLGTFPADLWQSLSLILSQLSTAYAGCHSPACLEHWHQSCWNLQLLKCSYLATKRSPFLVCESDRMNTISWYVL